MCWIQNSKRQHNTKEMKNKIHPKDEEEKKNNVDVKYICTDNNTKRVDGRSVDFGRGGSEKLFAQL